MFPCGGIMRWSGLGTARPGWAGSGWAGRAARAWPGMARQPRLGGSGRGGARVGGAGAVSRGRRGGGRGGGGRGGAGWGGGGGGGRGGAAGAGRGWGGRGLVLQAALPCRTSLALAIPLLNVIVRNGSRIDPPRFRLQVVIVLDELSCEASSNPAT